MGRYDDISDERLKAELTRFARVVLRMEEEGVLLDRTASIQRLLGELRQMVFAFEVRNTRRDQETRMHPRTRLERLQERASEEDAPAEDSELGESLRVVREAIDRERELLDRLDEVEAEAEVDDDAAAEGDDEDPEPR
jgi:hypothetical protein